MGFFTALCGPASNKAGSVETVNKGGKAHEKKMEALYGGIVIRYIIGRMLWTGKSAGRLRSRYSFQSEQRLREGDRHREGHDPDRRFRIYHWLGSDEWYANTAGRSDGC